MKILGGVYPLTQLINGKTQKTAPGSMKGVSADTADAGAISAITGKALIRSLNTIEAIASEITDIVDRYAALGGRAVTGDEGAISAQTLQFRPVVPGDVLIVVPDRGSSGVDTGTGRGSLLMVRNLSSEGAGGVAGMLEETEIGNLSKDIVDWLGRLGTGIRRAPGMGPMEPAVRFVVSVEDGPGPFPVVLIRHRDMSGKAGTLEEGVFAGRATLAHVIRALVRGPGEAGPVIPSDLSSHRVPRIPGPAGGSQPIVQEAVPVDRPDSSLPSLSDFDLLGKAKEMFSRLAPEMSHTAVAGRPDEEEAPDLPPAGAPENPASLAANLPGLVVTVLDAQTGDIVSPDAKDRIQVVAEKMVRLSGAVEDLANLRGTERETGSDEVSQSFFKEAVKGMVKDSFLGAMARLNGGAIESNPGAFGITLDETGGLKIDSAILKDALGAGRDEAVRFVRGFAGSLHDRIAYDFNPLAGVSGGVHENTSLRGLKNDENVAGEERNAKADFEKKLNELQMLLKNSHELKDSFMRRRAAGQEWPK